MGYTNKDKRLINISRAEQRHVSRLRRRALKRELHGERCGKQATRATRNGWWYA